MPRRPLAFRPGGTEFELEPRLALSAGGAAVASASPTPTAALFHHDGIDGLALHHSFLTVFDNRVTNISAPMMKLVSQAFSVFSTSYAQLPANPSPGTVSPALSGLLQSLTQDVDHALSVRQMIDNRPSPSVANGPTVTPYAQQSLIPYANAQVAQLGTNLASLPVSSSGASAAIDAAFDAIANAIAEYSIHPLLFNQPSDFYISPNVTFPITFTSAPATTSPGYFVRGPGGVTLPGAVLHANYPA